MTQFWWIIPFKKYTGFSGYVLFFGTSHTIIVNIGPRADPFAPNEDGETRHLLNKKWCRDKQQRAKSKIFSLRFNPSSFELIFLHMVCASLSPEIWPLLYRMKLKFGQGKTLTKAHVITMKFSYQVGFWNLMALLISSICRKVSAAYHVSKLENMNEDCFLHVQLGQCCMTAVEKCHLLLAQMHKISNLGPSKWV